MSQKEYRPEIIPEDDDLICEEILEQMEEGRKNKMINENRLIVDMCTPTADRRPTTQNDVEEDIIVENLSHAEEVYHELLMLAKLGSEEEEIEDEVGASLINKIKYIVTYLDDPGDGSPNILYCCVDGQVMDEAIPYDCLKGLNLDTCNRKAVVEAVQEEFADEFDEYF